MAKQKGNGGEILKSTPGGIGWHVDPVIPNSKVPAGKIHGTQ